MCFTSPLDRARETAEIILEGREVPVIEDERIIEMGFGSYEGGCCSGEGWNVPDSFQKFLMIRNTLCREKGRDIFTGKRTHR